MSAESPSDDPAAFEQAISHGIRFWRRQSADGANVKPKRVLVDLLVDHPVYYLGNLIVGKYLELTRGLKPWALVSSATDQKIILLARSFGIEQFTFVRDEAAKDVRPEAVQIIAQLEGLTGHELRRRVLGLNVNGLSVGDLLYDTYLRETRQVTMHEVDDDLRAYAALMLNYYALFDRLLQDEEVGAAVMGHLVYLRFGILARLAAAQGADIYARYGGKGMRIQRRRGVEAASDVMTRIIPGHIDRVLKEEGEAAIRTAEETLHRRMGGSGNEFEFLNEEGYSPARRKVSTNELGQSMGLGSDRPKGLLMLHAFPDANHFSPELLFDDFYDWYLQTLEAVRDQPEIDWLVKLHPNLAHYTDDPEPASRAYAIARDVAHIHVVPEGLNTASLAQFADFLITVNGKAGLEFAGCGMPVILGGCGFFAGNGFSEEPQTVDAYLEAVARGPKMSQDETQQTRALIANDLFYRRFIVDCRYLPDTPYSFWKPFDEGAFWRGYVEALGSGGIADDPLFQAMGTMHDENSDTFLRPA